MRYSRGMSESSKTARATHRSEPVQGAYSRLTELMQTRRLTVVDFHKALMKKGHRFDLKTIYRLASDKPLVNISAPVVRAVCETLNIDLGKLIVWQPPAPKLQRIDAKTQKRLDYLMARSNEGELTEDERTELEKFATELEAARPSRPPRSAQDLGQRSHPGVKTSRSLTTRLSPLLRTRVDSIFPPSCLRVVACPELAERV
jgi:hypothetical protein